MNTFEVVLSTLFLLLLVAGVATIIKYPKDVLIDLPAGIIKIGANRFLNIIKLITFPFWFPLFILDEWLGWGIFEHRFFRIFNSNNQDEDDYSDIPDVSYPVKRKVSIDVNQFSLYYISKNANLIEMRKKLQTGIESVDASLTIELSYTSNGYSIVNIDTISLYNFFYLIHWLQIEIAGSRVFGYASNESFSFYATYDTRTLNNLIGKTSTGHEYAFSMVDGDFNSIGLSDELNQRIVDKNNLFAGLVTNEAMTQ